MKKVHLLSALLLALGSNLANAQDSLSTWKKGAVTTLALSQSSFTNWAQGGQNNFNLGSLGSFFANQKKEKSAWDNSLDAAIGYQSTGDQAIRKSEDRWLFSSKYGLKATGKTNYSALIEAKSQFVNGYNYPNDTTTVFTSTAFSPGYGIISVGIDNKNINGLAIYVSPITAKLTTVFDKLLSSQGAYGVDTGKNLRKEFGWYANLKFDRNVSKQVSIMSRLDLFSNYEKLGVIDVNWDNLISFQISKYFYTNLTATLIYDEDILIGKEEKVDGVMVNILKPRTQFKQVLTLGVTVKF